MNNVSSLKHSLYINQNPATPPTMGDIPQGGDFSKILMDQVAARDNIKFSNHAKQRLLKRDIHLTPRELEKIGYALDQASQKGAKESLLVLNNLALVVSVPGRTVITALDGESMKNNVFTNIDSAVVI